MAKRARPNPNDDFFAVLCGSGLPRPVREYRWAKGLRNENGRPRQWRFDFAWPDLKIACEVEGASGMMRPCRRCGHPNPAGGRHHTADGYAKDCEKYNAAHRLGWVVQRVVSRWIGNGIALRELRATFEALTDEVEVEEGEPSQW